MVNYKKNFIKLLKKLAYVILGLFTLGLSFIIFIIMFKNLNESLTYDSYIATYTSNINNYSNGILEYCTNNKHLFEHFSDEDSICLFGALPSYLYILAGYINNDIDKFPYTSYLKKSGSEYSFNEDESDEENTEDNIKKKDKGKGKAVDSDSSSPGNLCDNFSHNNEEDYVKHQEEYDAKFAGELQMRSYAEQDIYDDNILSNIGQEIVEYDSDSYSIVSSDIHSDDSPDIKQQKQALKHQDDYLKAEKVVLDNEALELEHKVTSKTEHTSKDKNESTNKVVDKYDDIVEDMLARSREYARMKSTSPPVSGPHGEASGTQHQSYAAPVSQDESSTNKRKRDSDNDSNHPNKNPKK